jgi:hypothetical protein
MDSSKADKAAGPTGMTLRWLLLCRDKADCDGRFPATPSSPMGTALWSILSNIFTIGSIPTPLLHSLLHSIYKSGDRKDPSNYRPISLLECTLKLLTTILHKRLVDAGALTRLAPEQAGFRAGEECVTHVIAILDIGRRRQQVGLPTIYMFFDVAKAFDNVPHDALLYKLQQFGIRGNALRLLAALYAGQSQSVLLNGLIGPTFSIGAGVRQGCTLSPLLFNIYVNDLCSHFAESLDVPGLPRAIRPIFLYADDICILADCVKVAQELLVICEKWLQRNGLELSLPKCAAMATCDTIQAELCEKPAIARAGPVQVVDQYKYLGCIIPRSLNVAILASSRLNAARGLLKRYSPALRAPSIPLMWKLDLIRMYILPLLHFGGEVTGSVRSVAQSLEVVQHELFSALLGDLGQPASVVVCTELSIPSTCSTLTAMCCRPQLRHCGPCPHP